MPESFLPIYRTKRYDWTGQLSLTLAATPSIVKLDSTAAGKQCREPFTDYLYNMTSRLSGKEVFFCYPFIDGTVSPTLDAAASIVKLNSEADDKQCREPFTERLYHMTLKTGGEFFLLTYRTNRYDWPAHYPRHATLPPPPSH